MFKLLKNMRRREVVLALVCVVLIVGQVYFELTLPDYMSELTTLMNTVGTETSQIWDVGLKMLLCALCSAVLSVICGYFVARISAGFSFAVRKKLFSHVMDSDLAEMNGFSVAGLITRTTNDVTQIQMFVSMGLQMMVKSPIMAVWAVIKILGKSWELSVVTAGFVVAILVLVFTVMAVCLPRFRKVQRMTDKINRVARENLSGINVVHAFNAEDYQNKKFDGPSSEMYGLQLKNQKTFAFLQPSLSLAMNALALVVFWFGAALINGIQGMEGRLAMFSDVMVFGTYATYVVMSFMMLAMVFMMMPQAQVSAERINAVLDSRSSVTPGTVTEGKEVGTVEFRDVSFRYPDSAEDELSHVSFKLNKGETLAIIGATGSGKTTLVGLIPRFYDATEGTVLVDGVDVKDYTFDALYDKLGYVTQKAVLFSGTVADNVFFGESAADETKDNLTQALDVSQAADRNSVCPLRAHLPVSQKYLFLTTPFRRWTTRPTLSCADSWLNKCPTLQK